MNGKKARKIRKMLDLHLKTERKHKESSFYSAGFVDQSSIGQKLIIDGTEDQSGGGSRIEYIVKQQVVSGEDRRMYREVKKIYKDKNHPKRSELLDDMAR